MSSTRIIQRRIKSAKNIAQITRAMQMVAASKMKKSTDKAISGRPYANKIFEITASFASRIDPKKHPLLKKIGSGSQLVIIISTNKGLCGGLNSNLFRTISNRFIKNKDVSFITVGKKAKVFVVRTARELIADFSDTIPFFDSVSPITKLMVDGFLNDQHREVFVVYNDFVSALKQVPVVKQILPIGAIKSEEKHKESSKDHEEKQKDCLVEPSIDEILDRLLFHYLENQLRDAILEGEASEHSARMVAMKNATESARDLTTVLTLEYNKARQQGITFEIADMVTARLAVGE